MKEVVASGRTVEDAKQEAMKELGAGSLKEVEVEVIDEGSKGVFGWGTKYARVRVRLLEEPKTNDKKPRVAEEFPVYQPAGRVAQDIPERKRNSFLQPTGAPPVPKIPQDYTPPPQEYRSQPEYKPQSDYKPAAPKPEPRRQTPTQAPAQAPAQAPPQATYRTPSRPAGRPPARPPAARPPARPPARQTVRPQAPVAPPEPPPEAIQPPMPEPVEVISAPEPEITGPFAPAEVIKRLMELMNLEAEIEKSRVNGSDMYSINGKELGVLIGKHGQTLEALQFIINLILLRKTEAKKKINIDVEGYRARREKSLRDLARRIADKAKRERRKVVLEPMLPSERRIIHLTLQRNPYISTYSQGEEPMRRVVISPKRPRQ